MYDPINKTFNLQSYILDGLFGGMFGLLGAGISSYTQEEINYENGRRQKQINDDNIAFQRETNAMNQANFNRSFDYTVQQNLLQQQREDTAHQREVQDLMKAGLSPLAATSGATAGTVNSTPSTANLVAPQGVAFQADSTGFLQAGAAVSHLGDIAKDIYSIKNENDRAKAKNDLDREIAFAQINNSLDIAMKQISSSENIENNKMAQQDRQYMAQLKQTFELTNEQLKATNRATSLAQQQFVEKPFRECGVQSFIYEKDFNKVKAAQDARNKARMAYANKIMDDLEISSSSWSSSKNGSASLGSQPLSGSVSKGNSTTRAGSSDRTRIFIEKMRAWDASHPVTLLKDW